MRAAPDSWGRVGQIPTSTLDPDAPTLTAARSVPPLKMEGSAHDPASPFFMNHRGNAGGGPLIWPNTSNPRLS